MKRAIKPNSEENGVEHRFAAIKKHLTDSGNRLQKVFEGTREVLRR